MPDPMSTHLPEVSGGITAAFTGTVIVDTGLRDLQSFTCTLAQDAVANASSLSWELVTQVAGNTRKVTIKSWKADGATAGSVSAIASWLAIGF
jgi:hypothetical protein